MPCQANSCHAMPCYAIHAHAAAQSAILPALLPARRRRRREEVWAALGETMNGAWAKDKGASDPMDEACQAMRLNGLVRSAVGLIKGVEIK